MNIDELLAQRAVELEDDRRKVLVSGRRMRDISSDSLRLLEQENETRMRFFRFGDVLAEVAEDEKRGVLTRVFSPVIFKGVLDRLGNYVKINEKGQLNPARPPPDVVADILALTNLPLPMLEAVVKTPVFSAAGDLEVQPGYQPSTKYYLDLSNGLTIPKVPSNPTADDIKKAKDLLLVDLLEDFPLVEPSDKAHAVTAMLNQIVRKLIAGPTPLTVVESPTPGTGKGLLTDMFGIVVSGDAPTVMTEATNEEEWRKRLTAALITSPQVLRIDNIHQVLDSSALSAALTADIWEDRILGLSRTAAVPVRCLWLGTANNPSFSLEMARRTVSIRLDSGMERPEDRKDFKHPYLANWAKKNRGELICALLTLVRAWIVAGKPSGTKTLGSYESWAAVMGGILGVVGIEGFLEDRERVYAAAEQEAADWLAFCNKWWNKFQDRPVGSDLLFDLVRRHRLILDVWGGRDDHSAKTRFGIALSKRRDRIIGKYCIKHDSEDTHAKLPRYRLELLRGVRGVAGGSAPQGSLLNREDSDNDKDTVVPSDNEMGQEKPPQPPATPRSGRGDSPSEEAQPDDYWYPSNNPVDSEGWDRRWRELGVGDI